MSPNEVPDMLYVTKEAANCNEAVYSEFVRSRKEMQLYVEHDVFVRLK